MWCKLILIFRITLKIGVQITVQTWQIAVQMCQIYKLPNEMASALTWWFPYYKNPKNKNGLTPPHLATFVIEFYTCQNAAIMWSGVKYWLKPLHLAAFCSELE